MIKVGDRVRVIRDVERYLKAGEKGIVIELRNDDNIVLIKSENPSFGDGIWNTFSTNVEVISPATTSISNNNTSETGLKPQRYNRGELEVWDAWYLLNLDPFQASILKYIYRYKDKDDSQDLVKAMNYVAKMISLQTGVEYQEVFKMTLEELNTKFKKQK